MSSTPRLALARGPVPLPRLLVTQPSALSLSRWGSCGMRTGGLILTGVGSVSSESRYCSSHKVHLEQNEGPVYSD